MKRSVLVSILAIVGASLLIVAGSYAYKQYQSNKAAQKLEVDKNMADPNSQSNGQVQFSTGSANVPALPASPSAKDVDGYIQKVQAMAQDTDLLELTSCIATPSVFKIKEGDKFQIKNNDDKTINVAISPKASYELKAKETKSVTMTASAAIYKYNCIYQDELIVKQAGILEVTK